MCVHYSLCSIFVGCKKIEIMPDKKLKIFVSAYACEPDHGSEIGVGWHWVLEMSRHFELWVLTRESNRGIIEPWIAEHPEYAGIHFLYFDLPKWARFWKRGLRGVRTYYNIWQTLTNGIVKRTMQREGIRIFHHLTYGNVLWKVSRYGQRQFFIWGPVGGVETIPSEYSRHYSLRSRWLEALRRAVVACLPLNLGFRTRCRHANLIMCKTELLRQLLPADAQNRAILLTDVAVDTRLTAAEDEARVEAPMDEVRYITVGRLDAWRGFDLVLEAFAQALAQRSKLNLTILGNGSDRLRLERLAARLGISERVDFAGTVSMEEYRARMRAADVVVNASLKEGAVTVSFDSMAMGKPLICIDTTGYTRYFSPDYAELIERRGRDATICALAESMLRLTDAARRIRRGLLAQQAGREFSWAARGLEIRDAILKAWGESEPRMRK